MWQLILVYLLTARNRYLRQALVAQDLSDIIIFFAISGVINKKLELVRVYLSPTKFLSYPIRRHSVKE